MEMPKAAPATVRTFVELVPEDPTVTTKKVFGHPAAFVNGNMFFGVFGEQLFVCLSEADSVEADQIPGFGPFEPMPGRAMRGYRVLPPPIRGDRRKAGAWVGKALAFAAALPPKRPKPRAR